MMPPCIKDQAVESQQPWNAIGVLPTVQTSKRRTSFLLSFFFSFFQSEMEHRVCIYELPTCMSECCVLQLRYHQSQPGMECPGGSDLLRVQLTRRGQKSRNLSRTKSQKCPQFPDIAFRDTMFFEVMIAQKRNEIWVDVVVVTFLWLVCEPCKT